MVDFTLAQTGAEVQATLNKDAPANPLQQKDYIDSGDATAEANAKAFTYSKAEIDSKDVAATNNAVATANAYTDQQVIEAGSFTQSIATKGEIQAINLKVYPDEFSQTASTSAPYNNAPAGTDALRDAVNGKIYTTSEVVSGAITAIDFVAGTATVGGVSITLAERVDVSSSNISTYTDLVFDTLDSALNSDLIKDGALVSIKDRVSGKGGGADWNVVQTSSVTPDGFSIIQCISKPELSLVIKDNQDLNISAFGAIKGDSSFNSGPAINAAIKYRFDNGGGVMCGDFGDFYSAETIQLRTHVLFKGVTSSAFIDGVGSTIRLMDNSNVDLVRSYTSTGTIPSTDILDYIGSGGIENFKLEGNRYNQSGANDPLTGRKPNCLTASRFLELSVIKNVICSRAVGYGARIQDSTVPLDSGNLSFSENGLGGLSIDSFVTATSFLTVSGSRNPNLVEFDAQVKDISGHVLTNLHGEKNGNLVKFNSANRANISLINPTCWGNETDFGCTSGSATVTTTEAHPYMVGARVRIPGASGGNDLVSQVDSVVTGVSITLQAAPDISGTITSTVGSFIEYIGVKPTLVVVSGSIREQAVDMVDNDIVETFPDSNKALALYVVNGFLKFAGDGGLETPQRVTMTYDGTWDDFGAPWPGLTYSVSADGKVTVNGVVSSGTNNTSVATLPTGLRPASQLGFSTNTAFKNSPNHIIKVQSDGQIISDSADSITNGVFIDLSFYP